MSSNLLWMRRLKRGPLGCPFVGVVPCSHYRARKKKLKFESKKIEGSAAPTNTAAFAARSFRGEKRKRKKEKNTQIAKVWGSSRSSNLSPRF